VSLLDELQEAAHHTSAIRKPTENGMEVSRLLVQNRESVLNYLNLERDRKEKEAQNMNSLCKVLGFQLIY